MQQTWCDVKWCKVTHPPSVTHRHTTASTERRRHRDGEQGIIKRITNQPGSHGRPQPLTCFIHPLIQTATAAKEEETRKLREEEEELDGAASESLPKSPRMGVGHKHTATLPLPRNAVQWVEEARASCFLPVSPPVYFFPLFSCRMIHRLLQLLQSPPLSNSSLSQSPVNPSCRDWMPQQRAGGCSCCRFVQFFFSIVCTWRLPLLTNS